MQAPLHCKAIDLTKPRRKLAWCERAFIEIGYCDASFDEIRELGNVLMMIWPKSFVGNTEFLLPTHANSKRAQLFFKNDQTADVNETVLNLEMGIRESDEKWSLHWRQTISRKDFENLQNRMRENEK